VEHVNPLSYDPDVVSTSERPLRADAERNRARIMDAARSLFAKRGLDVTLNDIARHAGVGVGTVYRRFPSKDDLIDALFEDSVSRIAGIAREGLEDPDPWNGFVSTLERLLELQEADRGLKELLTSTRREQAGVARVRDRMAPIVAELMERARDAGRLRPDIVPQDFPLTQIMLGAVIDVTRDSAPGLWRRYLEIIVQGLRADPRPPAELAVSAPDVARMDVVMRSWRPPRRA
jgi:AcrR family transcriptional regulator